MLATSGYKPDNSDHGKQEITEEDKRLQELVEKAEHLLDAMSEEDMKLLAKILGREESQARELRKNIRATLENTKRRISSFSIFPVELTPLAISLQEAYWAFCDTLFDNVRKASKQEFDVNTDSLQHLLAASDALIDKIPEEHIAAVFQVLQQKQAALGTLDLALHLALNPDLALVLEQLNPTMDPALQQISTELKKFNTVLKQLKPELNELRLALRQINLAIATKTYTAQELKFFLQKVLPNMLSISQGVLKHALEEKGIGKLPEKQQAFFDAMLDIAWGFLKKVNRPT